MENTGKLPNPDIVISIQKEIEKSIKGLSSVVRSVVVALFAHGHLLLEGLPGVAKTTLLMALAKTISGGFSRISGTPDLMPLEFCFTVWPGMEETDKEKQRFSMKEMSYYFGPLLAHGGNLAIVLVDEINRIQSKTQSAFLEAMQEKAVTVGGRKFSFPHALFVATRNPLETEETFELPEAQRDRFMFEIQVCSPEAGVMREIIADPLFQNIEELLASVEQVIELEQLGLYRRNIQRQVRISPELADYIVRLAAATNKPSELVSLKDASVSDIDSMVRAGLSPRAQIILAQASRVVAWMEGRNYVLPQDVQEIFFEVCIHRFFLSRLALGRRSNLAKDILTQIIEKVPSPKG